MTQKMKKCANSANVEDQNDHLGTVTEGSVTMQLSFAAHHPLSKLFCHRSNPTTREVQWHRRCSNMPTLHVSRIKQLVHDTLSKFFHHMDIHYREQGWSEDPNNIPPHSLQSHPLVPTSPGQGQVAVDDYSQWLNVWWLCWIHTSKHPHLTVLSAHMAWRSSNIT